MKPWVINVFHHSTGQTLYHYVLSSCSMGQQILPKRCNSVWQQSYWPVYLYPEPKTFSLLQNMPKLAGLMQFNPTLLFWCLVTHVCVFCVTWPYSVNEVGKVTVVTSGTWLLVSLWNGISNVLKPRSAWQSSCIAWGGLAPALLGVCKYCICQTWDLSTLISAEGDNILVIIWNYLVFLT